MSRFGAAAVGRGLGLGLLLILGSGRPAFAHPGVHARLRRISADIARSPDDPTLYVRRGVIHCEHGDATAAAADFRSARRLRPAQTSHEVTIARAWLRMGRAQPALRAVDRRLRAEPDDASARWLRGLVLGRQGRRAAGLAELERALPALLSVHPDHYLQRAELMEARGAEHRAAAVAGLEQGIARLGARVELVEPAVALYLALGRPAPALALLERLPPQLIQTPRWQSHRGDLLLARGDVDGARACYRTALAMLAHTSRSRPESRAMAARRRELLARLAALPAPED